MSQVPPPRPPADNTGVVVAATAGGGMLIIILSIVAVLALAGLCLAGVVFAILLPAVQRVKESANAAQSMNNVRQLTMAMIMYENQHRRLPPQYTAGAGGEPLHTWRTLLLPNMEQRMLFEQIKQDEPWNSAANVPPTQTVIPLYCSRRAGKPTRMTSYVAVAGEGFAFNKDQPIRLADFKDGHGSTIIMLEIVNSNIAWAEPRDVTLDELQLQAEGAPADAPNLVREGAAVGFADGSVLRLPKGITREDLRQRLTIAGGETVPSW